MATYYSPVFLSIIYHCSMCLLCHRVSLSCNACRPGRSLEDIQRTIATGDVSLTIYRFRKPEIDSPGNKPKDTIILYTTRNYETKRQPGTDLERFERKWPKCMNYCPRCKEMVRLIKIWNRDITSAEQDRPTDLSKLFSCPPCKDIVRKFRKFSAGAIREQNSEIILLTSPRLDDDAAEAEFDLKTTGNLKHTEIINKEGLVGAGAAETTGKLGGMEKKKIKEVAATAKYLEEKKKGKAGPKAGTNLTTGNLKHNEGTNKNRDIGAGAPRTTRGNLKHTEGINKDRDIGAGAPRTTGGNLKHTEGINKDRDIGAGAPRTTGGNLKHTEGINKDRDIGAGAPRTTGGNLKHTEGINKDRDIGAGAPRTTGGNLKHTEGINKDRDIGAGAPRTTGGNLKHTEGINKDRDIGAGAPRTTGGNLKHTEGINKERDIGAGAPRTTEGLGRIEKEKTKYVGTRKDLGDKKKGIDKDGVVGAGTTGRLGEMKEEKKEITDLKIEYLKEKMKKETGKAEKEVVTPKSNKTSMPELVSDQRDDLQGRKGGIQEKKGMQLMKVTSGAIEADVQSSDRTDECTQDVEEVYEFIQGNKICKIKNEAVKQDVVVETVEREILPLPCTKSKRHHHAILTGSDKESVQSKDGVLMYQLSDPKYIENGWTQMPKEVLLWKVTMFQMHPAPHTLWWLELNKSTGTMQYRSGEKLATFDDDGTRLYYTNGELAMEYYKAEERNAGGHRVVVYSTCKSESGLARPRTVLAMFDYAGNGLVYDHAGQLRLKYTQNDGITLDPSIGPHTHWKWHSLNDPPILKTVLIEKRPRIKDPVIHKQAKEEGDFLSKHCLHKSMLKSIREKKWMKKYVPFQIKMKAFKINEHFSLRIHEQSSILLCFSGGRTNIKINVGMILDPSVVVGEEYVEVQEVQKVHGFEARPAGSESVERLQRVVQGARAAERARVLRERKLRLSPSRYHQIHHKS